MHIYAEKRFLDNNIKNISYALELEVISDQPNKNSYLAYDANGLSFVRDAANPKEFVYVDFLKGKLGWRIKRAEHESNLKKALGKTKKELNIFDATAGFLSDSMIFLSLGHKVMAVEQSKIIFYLVEDAIKRAQSEIPFLKNLSFLNGNSLDVFKTGKGSFDAIYLDPMYPIMKKNVMLVHRRKHNVIRARPIPPKHPFIRQHILQIVVFGEQPPNLGALGIIIGLRVQSQIISNIVVVDV